MYMHANIVCVDSELHQRFCMRNMHELQSLGLGLGRGDARGRPQNSEGMPAPRKLSCGCWRYQCTRGEHPGRTTTSLRCPQLKTEKRRRGRSGSADSPARNAGIRMVNTDSS
jgi:hypothetical protein